MTWAALLAVVAAVGGGVLWQRRCAALVARAGHELRAPLQAVRLGLQGLGAPGDGPRLAALDFELRRAALALDDLSAAVRGRRAGSSGGEVELGALLAEAAGAWALLSGARGATVVVEPVAAPVVVRADRLRLAQACANLVSNAIEHGGGEVRVRARVLPGGPARVEVTDGGPGLPAPISELLKAARGGRERRGHGLAVAAGVAARCGGRLTTAPSPRGARLVLELPLAAAPAPGRRGLHGRLPRRARTPPVLRRSAARLRRWSPQARILAFRRAVDAPAGARRAR